MLSTSTFLLPRTSAFGQIIGRNFDDFLNGDHKAKPSKITKSFLLGTGNLCTVFANLTTGDTERSVCRSKWLMGRTASPGKHILDELS
jgi:hypothetical protein